SGPPALPSGLQGGQVLRARLRLHVAEVLLGHHTENPVGSARHREEIILDLKPLAFEENLPPGDPLPEDEAPGLLQGPFGGIDEQVGAWGKWRSLGGIPSLSGPTFKSRTNSPDKDFLAPSARFRPVMDLLGARRKPRSEWYGGCDDSHPGMAFLLPEDPDRI